MRQGRQIHLRKNTRQEDSRKHGRKLKIVFVYDMLNGDIADYLE